jgi:hypothetical protein
MGPGFFPGPLSLAKIQRAYEINNIQRRCVACYMDEDRLVRSFGEGQDSSVSMPFASWMLLRLRMSTWRTARTLLANGCFKSE